jgi:thiopeptide-type bacteriocin biosynthesis protein
MPSSDDVPLVLEITAPRTDHDRLLRDGIAPIVRALASARELGAAYFERFNKPDWGIRLHVVGSRAWVEDHARAIVEGHLAALGAPHAYVQEWIGGARDAPHLEALHHADTKACLDILDAEREGALGTSRGQWSLLVVEELLNLFGLSADERLEFYHRGFQWSSDLGRWDAEVFDALERKFAAQEEALQRATLFPSGGIPDDAWGGVTPARIARDLLAALRTPVATLLRAAAGGAIAKTPVDLAVLAGHAHSNRLGVAPTQEATMRYLIWRARGGRRPEAS